MIQHELTASSLKAMVKASVKTMDSEEPAGWQFTNLLMAELLVVESPEDGE